MAASKLACPACGIGIPVQGPVAPESSVTCPECHQVFPAHQGQPPAARSSSGGHTAVVVVIVCVVLGLGVVTVLGAVVAAGMAYLLAAQPSVQPAAAPDVAQPAGAGPQVGEMAPEITGQDIDGKPMKLSDYRGKVVVLDFWGHW